MIKRLIRDEAGMTLALAIFMIVLIGVLGAGLLTFVSTDLNTVAETNRGQRAFEIADAGVRAAKAQLDSDSDSKKYNDTDADIVDSPWAKSKGGKYLSMDGASANVQIQYGVPAVDLYRVISTGCYPAADPATPTTCPGTKRKIEAIFRLQGGVGIPPTSFSRNDVELNGNVTAQNMSLFAFGNVTKTGGGSGSFTGSDLYFKKWAATADSYSYPNPYNSTARGSNAAAVGALGTVDSWYSSQGAPVFTGTASCTSGTGNLTTGSGIKMVADWSASTCAANRKISFPFNTSLTQLTSDVNALRQRAQDLEAATGYDYYRPGCSGSGCTISSWPANSDYQTVVFYDFPSYSNTNSVSYSAADSTAKGVIVVVNGNFSMSGSGAIFKGGIITYTNPVSATSGTATLTGSSNLSGYVNSTGKLTISGSPDAGSVPALNSLPAFDGSPTMISWRELYQ